jgi:hypothetical protein
MNKKDPELKKDFEKIIPLLYKLILVIPIMLIPLGVINYFLGDHNLIQMISIIAFAIVLYYILKGLIHLTVRQVDKM